MSRRKNLIIVAVVMILASAACLCTSNFNVDDLEGFEDFSDLESNDFGDINTTTSESAIELGTTGTGNISQITDAHNWTFQGTAGQTVIIETVGVGGTDPDVTLYDPSLNAIANNDDVDSGGNLNSYIETTLPVDGTYTARVEVWSTGDYQITVR